MYGIAWSNHLLAFQVSLDDQAPTTLFVNSSLLNSSGEVLFFNGLLFSQFNPTGSTHKLTIDNDNGQGILASITLKSSLLLVVPCEFLSLFFILFIQI